MASPQTPTPGTSTPPGTPHSSTDALAATLVSLRDGIRTPESLGRTLVEFVLTQAATEAKQEGDSLVMDAEIRLTPRAEAGAGTEAGSHTVHCFHLSLDVLHHHLGSLELCFEHETTTV